MNFRRFFPRFQAEQYLVLLYRIFIVYLLYSLSRLIFYLYNIDHFNNIGFDRLMIIFGGGLKFDTTAIIYTNLLFIVMSILPIPWRHNQGYQKVLKYIFFITNGIGLVANFADIPYFNFVLERTTIKVFAQFQHETNMVLLFMRFIVDYWPITVLYIFSMFLMVYLYNRLDVGKAFPKKWYFYYPYSIVVACIVILLSIAGIRGDLKHSTRPITMSNAGQYVKSPAELAIVLNTPFCLIRSTEGVAYSRQNYFADEASLEKVYLPVHYPDTTRPKHPVNVVIIIVESLNKEFIGSYYPEIDNGQYKGYAPFLDSLLKHARSYQYSFANGRKSIDALPSVLASIPAIESPFVLSPYYSNTMTTLPNMLKKMGYKSALFHGAPNGSMGFLAFGQLAGVDEYYGMTEYNNDKDFDGTWGIYDEEFLQYMANTIDTFSKPFLATVFTVSSHHPFKLPARYDKRFVSKDFPLQRCIEYTDYSIKRFMETASKMKWFNNTLFVITADHVSLNQRPEFKNDIGYFAVPIIFYHPGSSLNGIDKKTIAQQIDILPTVANYIGYPEPYFSFGQDLFNPPANKFAVNNLDDIFRFYQDGYLFMFNAKGPFHLYNMIEDPLLTKDLLGKEPKIQEKLELTAKAFIQQYKNRMLDNKISLK
ncbi:MAG TPA: sulfatase-like hydrolase/transferase [Bacteroidales bacterium]|nr:sulfatase-like hydrolase/transferase [Bacteroidales bacterium]